MAPGLGGWRVLSAAVLLLSTDVYSKAPSALHNVNTLPASSQSLLNQESPWRKGREIQYTRKASYWFECWEGYWGGLYVQRDYHRN